MRRKTRERRFAVLAVLEGVPEGVTGLDIWDLTGIPPGTSYPILLRLRHNSVVQRETSEDGLVRYRLTPPPPLPEWLASG